MLRRQAGFWSADLSISVDCELSIGLARLPIVTSL
jgi:hypothetical protein